MIQDRIETLRRRLHDLTWREMAAPQASIYDEPKFDGRVFSQTEFIAYCRALRKADALLPVQTVVVHHSATAESSYGGQSLAQVLRNWWNYYRKTKGWSGGPHGVIMSRDPGIGILNSLTMDGIHCSGNNANSRGGEIVGNFTSVLPTGKLLENAVVFFAGTLYAGKMTIDALRYHRQYGGTACPGNKLVANWAWFRGLVEAKLREIAETEPPDPPLPDGDETTKRLLDVIEDLARTMETAMEGLDQARVTIAAIREEVETPASPLIAA